MVWQTSGLDRAADSALVVWAAIGMAVFVTICVGLAKGVPPIVEAWGAMSEKRRQLRQRAEDARIVDLSEQVDHLTGRVWTLERSQERQRDALVAHAQWDTHVLAAAIAAGVDVTAPPPLWPPYTPTPGRDHD